MTSNDILVPHVPCCPFPQNKMRNGIQRSFLDLVPTTLVFECALPCGLVFGGAAIFCGPHCILTSGLRGWAWQQCVCIPLPYCAYPLVTCSQAPADIVLAARYPWSCNGD